MIPLLITLLGNWTVQSPHIQTLPLLLPKFDSTLVQAVAQEVMKLVKGHQSVGQPSDSNAFAHFAGLSFNGSHSDFGCAMMTTA